ncbi:MAG: hypothetical protein ACXAC8_10005 [Candidatus Hodarchaeales archaeon]
MSEIPQLLKYTSLENFALDQTEQFLKPRTFLDMLFLLILIFWWISAFLFPQNTIFRASMFVLLIGLFVFTPIYILLSDEEKSAASSLNRAVKIFLFFILILFSTNNTTPDLWDFSLSYTYGELERAAVCFLIPLTILLNRFSPRSLRMGYVYYIQNIFQGFWTAVLILYIFKGIMLFFPISFFPLELDILLIFGFGLYFISNLFPEVPVEVSLSPVSIFDQYQALKSRPERIRDALLFSSICLLIFSGLGWVGQNYAEIFQYIAVMGLFIGLILIFTPKKERKNRFGALMNSFSNQAQIIDPTSQLGNRVQNFAKTIQKTEFQKPERVFTIPTDKLKLVSKGKTTVSANRGSIAVPTITENGTALVLIGKSELETRTEELKTSTKKQIEGTTTLWLKPEEWEKIKLQLIPKEAKELSEEELNMVGIKTASEVFENTKKALNDLKTWKGPQGLFSSIFDTAPSKYSITETEDYSLVRLPGVYVFESKVLQLVNILGGLVKVIEMKGVGEYVQILGGFITVMETPDYSFVQTPFVTVIETPKGEVVKVLGINIQEGEKIDMEEMRSKIILDQSNFDALFTKRVESLFEEDPQVLLTDSEGERMGFLVGENETLSDIQESIKRVRGAKSVKGIQKTKFFEKAQTPEKPSSNVLTLDIDSKGIPKEDPQLVEIEEEIARISNAINAADEKFLNNEISENKHTEIVNRLKIRNESLIKEKEKKAEQLKLKFV